MDKTISSGNPLDKRRAGILLHPVSLPGSPRNGDLGSNAYWFVDFLAYSGMTVWQTLPLGPTHEDGSPYQCQSAHAGNPLLISLEALTKKGWLKNDASSSDRETPDYRAQCLRAAHEGFRQHASKEDREAYEHFLNDRAAWLNDYALFHVLKNVHHRKAWQDWAAPLRDRDPEALAKARERFASEIEQCRFEQFLFFRQWLALKQYANEKGILLFGDLPIFVAGDSVDVWAGRENFLLNDKGRPTVVAGVPPDCFSATGQHWGNPHYNWEYMQANGFQWWTDRLYAQQVLFDMVRIDHFRGFEAYWEIPGDAKYAIEGRWVKAPGKALFETLQKIGSIPLIAEDLGFITPEVTALRRQFDIPGMKVLQFAFDGGADNPYLPHNHTPDSVIYTGTHDNNTTLGWFRELPAEIRAYVCEYLGTNGKDMPWALIRTAFSSVGRLAVIPMQDALAGDAAQRMNTPGTSQGNWRWRFAWDEVAPDLSQKLRRLLEIYGRGC